MLVIPFPNIDPYIIRFGELGITWYSLAYVVSILIGWQYCNYLVKKTGSSITAKHLDDFVTWVILGVILGGRLGHVIFYEPMRFLHDPIAILQTYKGGMSFHGGCAGVAISCYLFCRKYKIKFFELADLLALVAPIGLFFGRIANFINGELYGSISDLSWAVVFPEGGNHPRHPSQLYEALGEGLLLFLILNYLALIKGYYKKQAFLSGGFLVGYAIARSVCEIFRVPDFEIYMISAGQLYSIPMMLFGLYLIKISYGNKAVIVPSNKK